MSDKDEADLRFALGLGVDLIALSFVRSPDDIKLVHQIMAEEGAIRPVIAKVEKPEAVDHLEAIVLAFDGVMVARGDLGVELPLDQVPLVQKRAVQLCRENAKPVIVATQMLDSMIENSPPDPRRGLRRRQRGARRHRRGDALRRDQRRQVPGAHGQHHGPDHHHHRGRRRSACRGCSTTRVPTAARSPSPPPRSPATSAPRRWSRSPRPATPCAGSSRLHCELPLLAFTPVPEVRDQLALSWGVETFLTDFVQHTDDMFRQVDGKMLGLGLAKPGDYVVVVAGSPPNAPGSTNTLRVHQLGSLVDPADDVPVTAAAGAGRGRPAARGPRPQAARPGHLRRREPAGRRAARVRRPGRRPGAGRRRPHRRPVPLRALPARLLRPPRRPHRADRVHRRDHPRRPVLLGTPVHRPAARQARSSSCPRPSRSPSRASTTTRRRPAGVPGPDEVPTMRDWVDRYPDRAGDLRRRAAGRRRALRRRPRLGATRRPRRQRPSSGSGCASPANCPTTR